MIISLNATVARDRKHEYEIKGHGREYEKPNIC